MQVKPRIVERPTDSGRRDDDEYPIACTRLQLVCVMLFFFLNGLVWGLMFGFNIWGGK